MAAFAQYKPLNIQQGKETKQNMMNKGMGMSDEMKHKQALMIQKYTLKRDELSDQIRDEQDSKKKQALMGEQLELIKTHEEHKRMMKKKMMKKHHKKMMGQNNSMKMKM